MLFGNMRGISKIRKMAKNMGINTNRIKKSDIIRAIQRKEGNIDCFGSPRVEFCSEQNCLWRNDCLSLNDKMRGK
jgi:DNA-binding IscR family transcriptional regulator